MAAVLEMSPFSVLRQLDQLGREHGATLPVQEVPRDTWEGVGFRLGTRHFVAAMGEVIELLRFPELSPVPRTRSWVRGMANVRGTLLPVMDLNGFLRGQRTSLTRTSRVLVIELDGGLTGLLVDEVFGMRHFPHADYRHPDVEVDETLVPFIQGLFDSAGEQWLVFSMRALALFPRFMKVTE